MQEYHDIMHKLKVLLWTVLAGLLACPGCIKNPGDTMVLTVYPDSVLNDVSNHPVGMNLNFLMDGGRFPDPDRSVTEAMKDMGVRYLRYPGGEKSDLYLFSQDPWEKSEPVLARTAGLGDYPGMFTRDYKFRWDPLDFDEYMTMCKAIGAEPVVVVAADNYLLDTGEGETLSTREELIRHAVEWVRYANVKKGYGVRYWLIGNESWNRNNVNSTVDKYARDVIEFSKAMKSVDSSIFIIANGDSDEFIGTVIKVAGDHIDGLCWSNYGVWEFFRGYKTYRDTEQILIGPTLTALDAVNGYATPEQLGKWKLIVAEYGPIDWINLWPDVNDLGHAIVTFDMAGQLLLQSQVEFSCFWNTRWLGNESDPGAGNLFVYLINKGNDPETVQIVPDGRDIASVSQAWEYFGTSPEDRFPAWQRKKIRGREGNMDLKGLSISVVEFTLAGTKKKT